MKERSDSGMETVEWEKLAMKHLMAYRSLLVSIVVKHTEAGPAYRDRLNELDLLIDGKRKP